MITSTENRANVGRVMALGFLLATLLAMVLSAAPPAGAAVSSGKAFSWGSNSDGQLGNATDGDGTNSDVPVAVKSLSNVKNIDGGAWFTLAATQ